ncbi:hypothetical protein F8388_000732 [Cannabis sativa]|uniref:Non-haem dioxygenase N-terminal domain-containing protein n=1 Tax=Cannabis sativa TaxID=3483 RepID=A0A7J6ECW3_CANSA|nr:hypothetical protein F8388_000732 [Cannabis sativa]
MASALSNSFNVTEFVVNQGNGVKGLADLGIEAVPQQYIQPLHERFDSSITNTQHSTIPIIDFSNSDDPLVKEAICEAAANWGFFQIVNHGIPIDILHGLKASVHRFFDLPVPEKRKYLKDSPSESVRLATSFSPRAEQVLEWKDYLMMLYVSEDEASASWPPECSRISIPIFVNPEPEALIGPLPQVLESGERPIYKQVKYSDYFNHFFSKPHDGKKAIEFAKLHV